MSEVNKHKSDFAERLPKHSPGKDLWPGIAQSLNAGSASLTNRLPKHKPANNLWPLISRKLPVPWYSLRSNYMRSILAGLMIILFIFILNTNEDRIPVFEKAGEQEQVEVNNPGNIVDQPVSGKVKRHQELLTEINEEKTKASPVTEKVEEKQKIQDDSNEEKSEILSVAEKENNFSKRDNTEVSEAQNTGGSEPDEKIFPEQTVEESGLTSGHIPRGMNNNAPNEIPSVGYFNRTGKSIIHKNPPRYKAKRGSSWSLAREVDIEAGIYFRPSMIKSISTIHDDWVYSPGAGVSIGMVHNRFLVETGVNFSRMEFEDKIELDYLAFIFLGTVIAPSQQIEEYVNEQGDTLTQVIYSVDVIDVYDSVFVADEKNDIVKLSTANIPVSVGFRVLDRGNHFLDLKTGLDMMIITGRIIPGNPEQEDIEMLEVRNSLAGKYSMKWKYHLSVGAGLRMNETMSVYAEPSLWWYPDGVRNGETQEIKNPFEAGVKIGLRWSF